MSDEFKAIVRERMDETGEKYTAAYRAVIEGIYDTEAASKVAPKMLSRLAARYPNGKGQPVRIDYEYAVEVGLTNPPVFADAASDVKEWCGRFPFSFTVTDPVELARWYEVEVADYADEDEQFQARDAVTSDWTDPFWHHVVSKFAGLDEVEIHGSDEDCKVTYEADVYMAKAVELVRNCANLGVTVGLDQAAWVVLHDDYDIRDLEATDALLASDDYVPWDGAPPRAAGQLVVTDDDVATIWTALTEDEREGADPMGYEESRVDLISALARTLQSLGIDPADLEEHDDDVAVFSVPVKTEAESKAAAKSAAVDLDAFEVRRVTGDDGTCVFVTCGQTVLGEPKDARGASGFMPWSLMFVPAS